MAEESWAVSVLLPEPAGPTITMNLKLVHRPDRVLHEGWDVKEG
jgi:hypothetical protein